MSERPFLSDPTPEELANVGAYEAVQREYFEWMKGREDQRWTTFMEERALQTTRTPAVSK